VKRQEKIYGQRTRVKWWNLKSSHKDWAQAHASLGWTRVEQKKVEGIQEVVQHSCRSRNPIVFSNRTNQTIMPRSIANLSWPLETGESSRSVLEHLSPLIDAVLTGRTSECTRSMATVVRGRRVGGRYETRGRRKKLVVHAIYSALDLGIYASALL
jgi:hypothetical protein